MFRRGLCLVLALQLLAVHLPLRSWCAELQALSSDSPMPAHPACPCDPTASKCECCCSKSEAAPTGLSMGRCTCSSSDEALAAAPTLYVESPPAFRFADPCVGRLVERNVAFTSNARSPEPPPPR